MDQPIRSRPDACDQCDVKAKKLMKCTACQQAWYCSKECQQKAWKEGGHKADCKQFQQRLKEQGKTETSLSWHSDAGSSSSRRAGSSSGAGSSSASRGAISSSRAGSSDVLPTGGSRIERHTIEVHADLPTKYKTAADPSHEELADPVSFTRHEKSALADIWPGLLHDGDTHGCTVPMHLMKKLKQWYLRKLLMRDIPGALASASEAEEAQPILQAIMAGEVKIASARLCDQLMGMEVPGRESLDMGFAFAMSVMPDTSPAGIARHSRTGAPKVMIFEPENYCQNYRMDGNRIILPGAP